MKSIYKYNKQAKQDQKKQKWQNLTINHQILEIDQLESNCLQL